MIKKIILGIILFSLISSLLAQNNFSIKDLEIKGANSISASKIEDELVLQDKSFWQKLLFWKDANKYYEADLITDLEIIKNYYQKEGFLDVEVDSDIKAEYEKETVKIEFTVQENSPIIVDKINYDLQVSEPKEKSELSSSLEDFIKDLDLKEGNRFRDEDLLQAKGQIEDWLLKNGYPYQEVSYNLQLKQDNNIVIVNFTLKTGPLSYFGEATFKGVEEVPLPILQKQISPVGKIYSKSYLQNIQRQIQNLGMFQYVTVNGLLADDKNSTIPIEINVKEASRLGVKLGVGYGQEDNFRTSITVTKLGFLGGIRKAVFFAKYSSLEPYNLSLKVTQPAFLHPDGSLTLNPYVRKEDETSYNLSRIGSSLTYQYDFNNYLSSYLGYGIEWNKLETDSPTLEDDLISEGKGDYKQSSATIGMSYDDSQPMFSPLKGWYFASAFTWAGVDFNSDYHYTMVTADVRKYTSIYKQLVLATRVRSGFMKPLKSSESTPIADRFFLGGSNSVRGWAYSDLGPKSEDNLDLGGDSMIESSIELRYPIWNIVSGVVFCDAGNVWEGTYDHNLTQLEYASGAGLRITTPLGPIRFDIAFPLSEPDKKLQYYINIGEAF